MPGKRISELTALSGAGSANNDDVLIFDTNAGVTKRISRSQLAEGMTPDLPLQYYLGVLNSNPTQRLNGNALMLGDYYLDAVTKYTTIYNGSGWNSYASVIAVQTASEAARDAAITARNAAQLAETNAETAETNAELAEVNAELAETNAEAARDAAIVAKTAAELAETNAETARDAAFVNANVYADTTAGLAAVALGEQFQVVSGDEIIRYREDAGPVATEVARYPSAARVDFIEETTDVSREWYVGYKQIVFGILDGSGLALQARYLDGSQEDWFAFIEYDNALWYAGYEQVSIGFSDNNGGIVSATLLGGSSFETFKLSADPYNIADTVVFVGDSLTQRGYPAAYQTLSGRAAINLGVGAQRSNQIAARIGAIAVPMTVSGGSIVVGANTVTHMNNLALVGGSGPNVSYNQFLSRGDDNASRSCTGTWGSVHGTLVRTASGGPPSTTETYVFTPDVGQVLPAKTPPGTPFIVDYAYEAYAHVIWIGRNNYDDFSTIMDNVESCVRRIGHSRYVVMSVINSTDVASEQQNQAGWTAIFAIENALAVKYPRNFLNIRRLLIDRGLDEAGLTATGADLADIALDTIPVQLKADSIHNSVAGDAAVAAFVNEFLTSKGF